MMQVAFVKHIRVFFFSCDISSIHDSHFPPPPSSPVTEVRLVTSFKVSFNVFKCVLYVANTNHTDSEHELRLNFYVQQNRWLSLFHEGGGNHLNKELKSSLGPFLRKVTFFKIFKTSAVHFAEL